MNFSRYHRAWSALCFLVLLISCNVKKANSTGRSLDQFAGGGASHVCSGSDNQYNDGIVASYTTGGSQASRDAVKSTLGALPGVLKEKVFMQKRTQIVISDDVTTACLGSTFAKAYAGQTVKPFISCHKVENGTVSIYIDNNRAKIKSSLIRAIGYYLAEIEANISAGPVQLKAVFVKSPTLDAVGVEMADLGITFLNDVAANPSFKLSTFSGMLPETVLSVQSASARINVWTGLAGPDSGKRQVFSSYVFAEAIDSYYCSNSSRAALVKSFPQTASRLGLLKASGGFNLSFGAALQQFFVPKVASKTRRTQQTVTPADQRAAVLQQPPVQTYYDPTTFKPMSNPTDAQAGSSVVYNPPKGDLDTPTGSYQNYSGGGSYVNIATGGASNATYEWRDKEGKSTGNYATLDGKGGWSYEPADNKIAPTAEATARDSDATTASVIGGGGTTTANVVTPSNNTAVGGNTQGDISNSVPPSPTGGGVPALNQIPVPITNGFQADSNPDPGYNPGEVNNPTPTPSTEDTNPDPGYNPGEVNNPTAVEGGPQHVGAEP
jgi:hypothetical protein